MSHINRTITKLFLGISLIVLVSCQSFEVIPEPVLHRTMVISEATCLNFKWWNPLSWFCYAEKPMSLSIRASVDNENQQIAYFLDYFVDDFELDLPIGVSIKLDNTYYNLKKSSIDYVETIKITNKISADILQLATRAKSITFNYTNRNRSYDIELSKGTRDELAIAIKELIKQAKSIQKMTIKTVE